MDYDEINIYDAFVAWKIFCLENVKFDDIKRNQFYLNYNAYENNFFRNSL